MTTKCEVGGMPAEHVATCTDCALYAGGLALLRDTWRAEHARDARWTQAQSERRLAAEPMPGRSRRLWVLALAIGALAIALFVQRRTSGAPSVMTMSEPAPVVVAAASSSAPSPTVLAITGREAVAPPANAPSENTPSENAPSPPEGARGPVEITAPAVSRLALGWSVTLDATAIATAHDHDVPPWLDLREGSARADTRRPGEIRTAQVVSHGDDAAWAMNARAGVTHVELTRGTVLLTARHGLAQRALLRAPASADVGSDGRIIVPAAPAIAAPADERASFALAESELARGDKARGRARLTALVAATDLAIAGDAAFLLARSSERPTERSAVLGHYLARRPPSPYREQALVEQAHAFVDAGDLLTARAIAADLRADPALPAVARPSLARLTARLAALPQ